MGDHQTNVSTHLEHERTIFYGGNGLCHPTFKQNNDAQVLHASNDGSKDTSECHLKCQKTRPNLVYYDETNSHSLDVDVFFANVPFSTQPMDLGNKDFFIFILTHWC